MAKKTGTKKTARISPKRGVKKGESLVCDVCGLAVTVEEIGDITIREESVILCCGKTMKKTPSKATASKK